MTAAALPPSYPLALRHRWSWGVWLLVIVGVVVEAAAALVATLAVRWGASPSCRDLPTYSNVRDGELGLLVTACVGLLPWALAMLASPRRAWLAVAGTLAVSPLIVGLVAGLDRGFWTGGWCF